MYDRADYYRPKPSNLVSVKASQGKVAVCQGVKVMSPADIFGSSYKRTTRYCCTWYVWYCLLTRDTYEYVYTCNTAVSLYSGVSLYLYQHLRVTVTHGLLDLKVNLLIC